MHPLPEELGDSGSGRPAVARSSWLDPRTAGWVIRVAALWLLAGALGKATSGSPSALPAPILESDLDPFRVIPAAVVIEITVALVAIMRPRWAWLPLALLFSAFSLLLIAHIRSGAEHCGCFGGALTMPAGVMLAIDAALAILVVVSAIVSRAWPFGTPFSGQRTVASPLLGAALVGVTLGWATDARLRPLRPLDSPASPPSSPASPSPPSWQLPETLPAEVILRPVLWINKRLAETELGRFTDVSRFPPTATIVIYYESCNHCADHLRELAALQEANPAHSTQYVLVQLPTPQGPNIKLFVDRVPKGLHVKMPEAITRWVITPPWDVFIEDGVVKRAERVKWSGER